MTDECKHEHLTSECEECFSMWNDAALAENKRVLDELTAHVCNQFFFRDASRELLLGKIDSLRLPRQGLKNDKEAKP